MTFGDKVDVAAGELGIETPLAEESLGIEAITLPNGTVLRGGTNNLNSRLFLEWCVKQLKLAASPTELPLADFRRDAEAFFSDFWHDAPSTGKHPVIDAFREGSTIGLTWKESSPRHPYTPLVKTIGELWERRQQITPERPEGKEEVEHIIRFLNRGSLRVAEPKNGVWHTRQWVKQAILLFFRLHPNRIMRNGPVAWDKVPNKFEWWTETDFVAAGFRVVPGAFVRKGAYIGRDVVAMPSFINIGAYVGNGTMIDTWSTVGSCAQIGARCHISGGVGIGGVLEPLQANPVIIEDDCFIGARSEVAEGVIVRQGSVLGMGVFLGKSTPIIDRDTGQTTYGEVPPYSVVIAGTRATKQPDVNLACAVIVKKVDAQTREKTSVNDLLRA